MVKFSSDLLFLMLLCFGWVQLAVLLHMASAGEGIQRGWMLSLARLVPQMEWLEWLAMLAGSFHMVSTPSLFFEWLDPKKVKMGSSKTLRV